MYPRQFVGFALLATAVACASGSGSATQGSTAVPPRNPDVITAAELADPMVATGSTYDAIRRLRPKFLMTRGGTSIQNPTAGQVVHCSVDGGPLQTLDLLNRIRPNEISEIRYLSSTDAGQRFGVSAGGAGVILVKTK